MKIQLISDLHLDIYPYQLESLPVDVTVLAGDIHTDTLGIQWAADTFGAPVLYVPGNHEFYDGNLLHTLDKMRAAAAATKGKVQLLERDTVVIDGVRFLGTTLWTDFAVNGADKCEQACLDAERTTNDYQRIRADGRNIRPADLAQRHEETRQWLRGELAKSHAGKTVVVTHHGPTLRSIPEWQRRCGDESIPAYVSDLTGEAYFNGETVQLWLHGHIHEACDYQAGGVRVVCNPHGYGNQFGGQAANNGFNPWWVIDV